MAREERPVTDAWYARVGVDSRWLRRILLVTFLSALVGIALGAWQALRTPPLYQVEVILAVYPTHYRFQSQPAISTLQRPRGDARQMAMVMARGPNVVRRVIERMGDQLPPEWRDWQGLKKHLVTRGGEGVYVYLIATGSDPDLVYNLATTWAQVVETEVETAFYRYDSDIPVLRAELETMETKLQRAEADLEAFRRRTGLGLVDVSQVAVIIREEKGAVPGVAGFNAQALELENVNSALAEYRHAQRVLRYLAQEARAAKQEGRPLSAVPLELIARLRPVQARARLTLDALKSLGNDYEAVARALEQEADELQPAIDFLAAESDRLQGALSADLTQLRQLLRQREALETLYKALLGKQEELKVEAAVASNYVDIVEVREPEIAGQVRRVFQVIAGGILGAFLGFVLAITGFYVRGRSL